MLLPQALKFLPLPLAVDHPYFSQFSPPCIAKIKQENGGVLGEDSPKIAAILPLEFSPSLEKPISPSGFVLWAKVPNKVVDKLI